VIYEKSRIEVYGSGQVTFGEHCIIGEMHLAARDSITFGEGVLVSWGVFIQDFDPHPTDAALRAHQVRRMVQGLTLWKSPVEAQSNDTVLKAQLSEWAPPSSPIVIGDNVWIGTRVLILKGARIGSNSVIAAGAVVVAGEYPPNSLIAGNPARVVKQLP
jgi:acetyltransferase-like isoleucine patch superfamily enzyme